MNSKSKYVVLLLSSVLVVYAIIGGMLGRVSAQDGSYPQLSIFMEVLNKIQSDYVDEPALSMAVTGAIRGLIERVDPNGGYLTPQDVQFYKSFDPVDTRGIGAILSRPMDAQGEILGYPVIVSAFPGGPADKAGLVTGDIIEAIDAITTREMNLVQVYGFLANPPDKPVSLTVIRRNTGEPEVISLAREPAKVPPVTSKMIEGNIAYLQIPYLAPGKAAEARTHLEGLLKSGAAQVVLDLRQSGGGEEQEALALANLFMESGTIASLQGQKVARKTLEANRNGALTQAPLVVLVNQGTAGPAELIAGAISDNSRGQLVGTRTFGSGSVQGLIEMDNGHALLLAVARYYTPTGKEIQNVGIRPTVEVSAEAAQPFPPSEEEIEIAPPPPPQPEADVDRQLNRAIEILKQPQATRAAA